jgi:DNA-binding CsgD family transcriptional regulator
MSSTFLDQRAHSQHEPAFAEGIGRAAVHALDWMDSAVFVVDRQGLVSQTNLAARTLLSADEALLLLRHGRLSILQPDLQERFLRLVHAATDGATTRTPATRAGLALPRPGRTPLTLAIGPLHPSDRTLALVLARDPETPLPVERLREWFGLTAREGRVAVELVRGCGLEDIARSHGVALATVRSQLKQILAKTGTHRQAQAVALLARSATSHDHR